MKITDDVKIQEHHNDNIDKSKVLPKEAFQKFADKEWNPTYQSNLTMLLNDLRLRRLT